MRLTRVLLMRYWRRYLEREMTHDHLRRQWKPIVGWKEHVQKEWHYEEHRPWTKAFKEANVQGTRVPCIPVEPVKKYDIYKGDRVEILVGKDKGKQGLVNCIIKERNWVYIAGLNCDYNMQSHEPSMMPNCTKHEKPLIITTQVKLVDPADNTPTDVEWRYTETGDHVRVSVKSGRIIPLPTGYYELEDFANPKLYEDSDKDSTEEEVMEETFRPRLRTFNEDIMKVMGIKEDKKWPKYYWY